VPGPTPRDPAGTTDRSAGQTNERLQVAHGEHGEVILSGEIDLATSRILRRALETAAAEDKALVVDLCDVLYLHSAGVAVLYDHAKSDMRVRVRPNTAVASVIRICGLSHLATVELVPVLAE
jgi:anti-anti-sigma factor